MQPIGSDRDALVLMRHVVIRPPLWDVLGHEPFPQASSSGDDGLALSVASHAGDTARTCSRPRTASLDYRIRSRRDSNRIVEFFLSLYTRQWSHRRRSKTIVRENRKTTGFSMKSTPRASDTLAGYSSDNSACRAPNGLGESAAMQQNRQRTRNRIAPIFAGQSVRVVPCRGVISRQVRLSANRRPIRSSGMECRP